MTDTNTPPLAQRPAPDDKLTRFIGGSPVAVIVRLLLVSILVGVLLEVMGLDPLNVFNSVEFLIRRVWSMGFDALLWVWRYLLLGAVIVIPIWIVLRLIRAPQGR